jgi:hypothetical protein
MNLKFPTYLIPSLLFTAGLASCYPVDDDAVDDYDLAATVYNKEYYSESAGVNKYQDFTNFYITDTITHVINEGEADDISRKYDSYIINLVATNMKHAGYSQVFSIDSTELYMTIAYTKTSFETLHYYFSGGGYYYPWASYGNYTTTYETGTLLISMVETARIDSTNPELPVIWSGAVNGVIEDSKANNQERLAKNINQCFIQSPYLNKTSN